MPQNYLLICQVGPVQEFIAQARSTRDCWSGSFLLSWMVAQWTAACRREFGTDVDFIFPVAKGGPGPVDAPTLDWIENTSCRAQENAKKALLPAIANRVMAMIASPQLEQDVAARIAKATDSVFDYQTETSSWREICDACWAGISSPSASASQWAAQLSRHWQVSWLLWPWLEADAAWDLFAQTPLGMTATAEQKDKGLIDAYHANFQLACHRLDARRQLRNFDGWDCSPKDFHPHRDAYSGKEEAVLTPEMIGNFRNSQDDTLRHLFRNPEPLGAPMVVKRVWHKFYLEQKANFKKTENEFIGDTWFNVPSLPAIAAYPWAKHARKAMAGSKLIAEAWLAFAHNIMDARSAIESHTDMTLPSPAGNTAEEWFDRVDWEIFQPGFWNQALAKSANAAHKRALTEAQAALGRLKGALRDAGSDLGNPGRHYAVLAMDGDGMGKLLSGQGFAKTKGAPPLLTRAFHEALSRGLVQVAARNIHEAIEESAGGHGGVADFQGKVIYAGADDLLVILPADQAIEAAGWFNNHFKTGIAKGAAGLGAEFPPPTASAGIAIGHFKAPLQDMVETAQGNLKKAKKDRGRNALHLSLFKRSGEILEWGAKFGEDATIKRSGEILEWGAKFGEDATNPSPGLALLALFQTHYRAKHDRPDYAPPISNRFPHRLAQALRPLAGLGVEEALDIVAAEFDFICSRQIDGPDLGLPAAARSYLTHLADPVANANAKKTPRVADFINLFLVEAFLQQDS